MCTFSVPEKSCGWNPCLDKCEKFTVDESYSFGPVPRIMEDIAADVQVTPHEHGPEFVEQSLNIPVLPVIEETRQLNREVR